MFESLGERLGAVLYRIRGRGVLRPEDVDAALREVRLALLEADVNYRVVKEFVERVRGRLAGVETSDALTAPEQVVTAVYEEMVDLLGGNDQGLRYADRPPTVLLLAGLQGSGKTTTAVKLALFARREGHKPMVVALDLRRPAAVEQLRVLAERERVPFFSGSGAAEEIARASLEAAARWGCDVVVLDTGGRQAVDRELMDELARIRSTVPVTESLLVADAMTGQEAVTVGAAFHQAVGIDGVVLTKLDGDARGGAALSLRYATGQTVRFAGVGERPADIEVFHADRMASRIIGRGDLKSLLEKAEGALDEGERARVEKSLRKGRLTFDDFLMQIRQVRSLGSFESVLEMMPGGGQLRGQLGDTDPEREMKKMEAIILSMTPTERTRPEIIDGSRRRRIASGSGTRVADVNQLLKAREQMQVAIRQLGLGRRRGLPSLGRLFG